MNVTTTAFPSAAFVCVGVVLVTLFAGCVDEVPDDPSGRTPVRVLVVSHEYAMHADVASALDDLVAAYGDRGEEALVRVMDEGVSIGDEAQRDALRRWLAEIYTDRGILSAILVGNVPVFFFDGSFAGRSARVSTDWPWRVPFADFQDSNDDGLIDALGGDLRALIPVGRVYANEGIVPGSPPAYEQVSGFLHRMAEYVRGAASSHPNRGLNFIDSAFGWLGPFPLVPPIHMEELYGEAGVDLLMDPDCETDLTTPAEFWSRASAPGGWDCSAPRAT